MARCNTRAWGAQQVGKTYLCMVLVSWVGKIIQGYRWKWSYYSWATHAIEKCWKVFFFFWKRPRFLGLWFFWGEIDYMQLENKTPKAASCFFFWFEGCLDMNVVHVRLPSCFFTTIIIIIIIFLFFFIITISGFPKEISQIISGIRQKLWCKNNDVIFTSQFSGG